MHLDKYLLKKGGAGKTGYDPHYMRREFQFLVEYTTREGPTHIGGFGQKVSTAYPRVYGQGRVFNHCWMTMTIFVWSAYFEFLFSLCNFNVIVLRSFS